MTAIDATAADAYLDALTHADETAAVAVAVGLLDAGVPVAAILTGLIAPAQRQVGEHWATGRWNVAREHAATHVSDRVVAALALRLPRPDRRRGRVVLACVSGEWHELAARMAGEVLRAEGWTVAFLGASTPAAHLANYLHDLGPDAVGLSCSLPDLLPAAQTMIDAARQASVPVLAGGAGFGPDGRWALALGATGWAADGPGAAARLAAGWPAFAPPPLGPPPRDDGEHVRLAEERDRLAAGTVEALVEGLPAAKEYDERRLACARDDIGRVTDFLAAALLVDDPELFTAFTAWQARVMAVRGVPRPVLTAGCEALAELLGADFPRSGRVLAQGLALLRER
ncbi:cobalamin B12-binding domain-containing protein [Actinomadura hibisca]|uniref:cobalamin B12-binding domain-containing protein n=1 Tax=Actinomadura hibisca TaxID=68565 RepID=UPI000A73C0C2|nr:cobalamin-dependent protein [Actinomadura hibisca]